MKTERPDGALLAGVCAGIARTFKWNVWVLRALFIGFLAIKTLAAILVYAGLALLFYLLDADRGPGNKAASGLSSPELSRRNERIRDLEKRFSELEESDSVNQPSRKQ
jgi:phage shock protein PspC (stress-responsive transcriptional regulator)